MRFVRITAMTLAAGLGLAAPAPAFSPYIQIGAGVASREVVEEGEALEDFKFEGDAVTTRLLARAGIDFWETVDLYLQGGGVDLSIDEFNNFSGDLSGAFGGGARVTLYRSGYPDALKLYLEGNALRFRSDDKIRLEVRCTAANGCTSAPDEFLARIVDEEIEWTEYVAMLGASGRVEGLRLYGGIRLSVIDGTDTIEGDADGNFSEGFKSRLDLEEDDIFGIFFGTDIFLDRSEKTAVNLEATLIDQDSISVGIRRSF